MSSGLENNLNLLAKNENCPKIFFVQNNLVKGILRLEVIVKHEKLLNVPSNLVHVTVLRLSVFAR